MDADTRDLLRGSIRALLESRSDDLVAGLAELGWDDVVSDDAAAATEMLFTVQGEAGRASAVLDSVVIDAGAGDLTRAHKAERGLVVVHPIAGAACARRDGMLCIDGVVLRDPSDAGGAVVPVLGNDASVFLLGPDRLLAATTTVRGFDPASSLRRVRLRVPTDEAKVLDSDWGGATATARRALASELVGNGCAMLDMAVGHVGARTQFGRPIGSYQAPRHSLAQCYTLLAGARELVHVAWETGTTWDTLVAKTYAGYASESTSSACLQVCGAIGLTSEHSLGRYAKRARVLDSLYGGWRHSMHDIGRSLLSCKVVPVGPPL